MQAFLAILRYDLWQLARSWLVRIWVALLAVPALFLVVVAANEDELASEVMAAYVAAVLVPLTLLAVAILTAAAVSGEAAIIADSILSKSVTRTEYLAAKIVSRLGSTLGVYLLITIPFAYLIGRYAVGDASLGGVIAGILMVAALIAFLAALGIALSTLLDSVQIAVLLLLVSVLGSGVVLQFLGLTWLSTTAVVDRLPETFRGDTSLWEEIRVLFVFTSLSAAAISTSLWSFRRRDL